MSNADKPNEPAAPEGAHPDPAQVDPLPARASRPAAARPAPRTRGGGSLALALLLSLIALAASGYIGWRQWQQEQGRAADSAGVSNLQQRVGTLETTLTTLGDQRSSLNQRLDDAAQVNRSLRDRILSGLHACQPAGSRSWRLGSRVVRSGANHQLLEPFEGS